MRTPQEQRGASILLASLDVAWLSGRTYRSMIGAFIELELDVHQSTLSPEKE